VHFGAHPGKTLKEIPMFSITYVNIATNEHFIMSGLTIEEYTVYVGIIPVGWMTLC